MFTSVKILRGGSQLFPLRLAITLFVREKTPIPSRSELD
jgi:hypothetical protein